ncbi:hypothetical protein ABKV19_005455 [Rosa sericea]
MLKMMMRPTPRSYSYCSTRETQLGNGPSKPRVSNVEDALKVFDEMLQRRPLPSVVCFNQLLGQLAKLKHYSGVLSLIRQMGLIGIAQDFFCPSCDNL